MRTIKTLGIATAMALALIAIAGAGAASANLFKAEIEPEKWNGSLAGKKHQLVLGAQSYGCEKVAFSGETKTKSLSEVTVTPELGECEHIGALPTGWAMNGCKFRLRPGAGPALVGTMDIVGCEKPMSNTYQTCVTEIGNQSGLGSVEYINVGSGSTRTITAVANINGLTFTRSGGCFGAETGTFSYGTYSGQWTIKGSQPVGGSQVAAWVESTSPPSPTVFAAEEAPVTIKGLDTRTGYNKRITGIGQPGLYCESYTASGTSASAVSETITVAPTYKKCRINGEAIPDSFVSAGGCSYVLHANSQFDIVGATCASNPITITGPGCVSTIGPQSGLSATMAYVNLGSGKLRSVSLAGPAGSWVEHLTVNTVGASCEQTGTLTGGKITLTTVLSATNSLGASQGISIE